MKQQILDAFRHRIATGAIIVTLGLGLTIGLGVPTPTAAAAPATQEPAKDCGNYRHGAKVNRTVENYYKGGVTVREVQTLECQDGQWVIVNRYTV